MRTDEILRHVGGKRLTYRRSDEAAHAQAEGEEASAIAKALSQR